MGTQPSEATIQWATDALAGGTTVVDVTSLHNGTSPWLLRVVHQGRIREVILRVAGRATPEQIATGAAALRVAEAHGLAAPRLIAFDLAGHATGAVVTLETALPGSSTSPPRVSAERLRAAGAALAKVHAIPLEPQPDLPLRIRPTQVDDLAMERRWAALYQAAPDREKSVVLAALCTLTDWPAADARLLLSGTRLSALLHLAEERLRSIARPPGETVFVHGDIWAGNMLWSGESSVILIDWKSAGVGDPGVDLGQLRMKMAIQYGPDAPAHVLDGWQRERGRQARTVAYWDVVAAVNSPAVLDDYEPGFDDHGHELAWPAKTERRDAFLRAALDRLDGAHRADP